MQVQNESTVSVKLLSVILHLGEVGPIVSSSRLSRQFNNFHSGVPLSEEASYDDLINCEAFPEVVNYTDVELEQGKLVAAKILVLSCGKHFQGLHGVC